MSHHTKNYLEGLLPGYTCPYIDTAIEQVQEIQAQIELIVRGNIQEAYRRTEELPKLLEDVRNINIELRKAAETILENYGELYDEHINLETERDGLEEELERSKVDCKHYEEEAEELVDRIKEINERSGNNGN